VAHSLLDGSLNVSATGFWTRLEDVIVFDFSGAIDPATDPFGRFGGYRNAGEGRSRGLELSLAARPVPALTLRAAYTFADAEAPTGATERTRRAYVVPRHQLSLVATQRIGAFDLNLDLGLRSDYLAPLFDPVTFSSRPYVFDSQARVDLVAGYRLRLTEGRVLRLFARLDDALDQDRFESGFRTPGRAAFAGAELEF
jgi:vitamin B12 transporter